MSLQKTITETMKRAWLPPPNFTVSAWADTERKLSPESSAEAGQWRTSRAEYQRGMMDAVNDPRVEVVAIMSGGQLGKTEALNNVVGYYISHDPAPILVLQPTLEMAATWSKDRLTPMLRDTPCLGDRIGKLAKTSAATILHKSFSGGHITMAGANSPSSLASRPIRIVLCDEVDRYPRSAGNEGDPVSLAKKRTATFWNRKIILTSTPTIKGASRIEDEFNLSDQRRYYLPCPHCGHEQTLKWSGIVFDKEDLSSVSYACENGCVIDESDKLWMISQGKWVAGAPFNGRAGFHINELYSPWRKWREVVADFLEAKRTPETLKTWVNTSLGETWEEKGEQVDYTGLLERREAYDFDSLPDDILCITAAVDTQGDRLEALSQGWGVDRERWNIEHRIFYGDPSRPEVWKELDAWLLKTYSVAGRGMKIAAALVDAGGHHTEEVYSFVKARHGRRVFAVKGSSAYYGPVASKPSIVGRNRVTQFLCGTDTAKDSILLSSMKLEEFGAGYIHFPHDVDDEFFKQLTAETRIAKTQNGQKRLKWEPVRKRNEILDLHVYNYCAYVILNPDIVALKSKRSPQASAPEPQPHSTIQPRRRMVKSSRKNWVTDF